MNPYKSRFEQNTSARTLADVVKDADVLVGLSVKGAFTSAMLKSMAPRPIVFAMANPDPELTFEEGLAARSDIIMASGRSDYPNQVNNVLGFPAIFRGALDCHATAITEGMKLAATRALAALAKENVPEYVCRAYGVDKLTFGPEYIIPKPFDMRVLVWEASAVAAAAIDGGVAQEAPDMTQYRAHLEQRFAQA
jgi:malate dehydrogenase (oxaloacetate-decarboxylating)(NADP+)